MADIDRRSFLQLAFAAVTVAAVGALTKPAEAMPAMPPHDPERSDGAPPEPAVATEADLDAARPQSIQWRGWRWRRWRWRRWRYRRWRYRRWGWRPWRPWRWGW